MLYELAMHESFVAELNRAPKLVQKAVLRSRGILENHPPQPDPPRIKRLTGTEDCGAFGYPTPTAWSTASNPAATVGPSRC